MFKCRVARVRRQLTLWTRTTVRDDQNVFTRKENLNLMQALKTKLTGSVRNRAAQLLGHCAVLLLVMSEYDKHIKSVISF